MNKYDDIKTLLFTSMDIRQSCEFLINYLKNYCSKPYNKEKIDSFYNNLAEILKKFLYFQNETSFNSPNPKLFQSLLQNLNLKNSYFEDFDILLNLFLHPSNLENELNIFSSIFIHNYGNTKFLFPITNTANSNKMILYYLNQNKSNVIFNNFGIFQILSQPKDDLIRFLAKKELILTIREYYIFIMLNFMKKSSNIIKVNVKDYYPNFKRYLENISEGNFYSKKTEFIINNFERDKSINYNFYNIMFLDFILFLHFSYNIQNLRLIEILTFAIEFIWLGDYLLAPQNYSFSDTNFNEPSIPVNSQISPISNTAYYNIPSNYTNNYPDKYNLGINYGPSSLQFNTTVNLTIPNILVLNCLQNLINLLQSKKYLFEDIIIKGEKRTVLKPNNLLFNLHNSLYNLFKHGFALFAKSDYRNSEVSLSDFASVWYSFLTPWESPFNNTESDFVYGNESNDNEKSFGFFPWSFINSNFNSKNFNSRFHNSFRKNSSPLKKFLNPHSSYLRNKSVIMDYLPYIEVNIDFYTDLFQDYLNAFSSCNILSVEELSILINSLEMYEINQNGYFINDLINYHLLRDFSNGKINTISQSGCIENLIGMRPHLRKFIFSFDLSDNINQIRKLISTLLNLIFKLSLSNDYRIEDSTRFIKKLERSIDILKNLYMIPEDEIEYKASLGQPIRDSGNVYDKRIFLESLEFDNPWSKKITSEESSLMYSILINVAYFVDMFRGKARRYDSKEEIILPITNLRYFCNYYNLISTIGMIIVFYFMIKLIILYLN